ncbi:hypothetical protein ACIQB5_46005 [Streptomyces sp. NPDC088560]|uniref:hypothetical protein n=1 Tax=Streptomyces sp. NPDC088560 TaxID=3365868 RepID=UPI003816AD12
MSVSGEEAEGTSRGHVQREGCSGGIRMGLNVVWGVLHSAVMAQTCLPRASAAPELREALLPRLAADVGEAGTPWAIWADKPMAALFLEAALQLESESGGAEDSPRGCYALGPASLPVSVAGRGEDRMCVNGVMLAASCGAVDELLHQMMQVLFPVLTPSEEDWGPGKHARIWRHAGDVLAVTQGFRLLGRSASGDAASAADVPLRGTSYLGFYYISESALRFLGGR